MNRGLDRLRMTGGEPTLEVIEYLDWKSAGFEGSFVLSGRTTVLSTMACRGERHEGSFRHRPLSVFDLADSAEIETGDDGVAAISEPHQQAVEMTASDDLHSRSTKPLPAAASRYRPAPADQAS